MTSHDLRQQELDKAFVDGAYHADDAIMSSLKGVLPPDQWGKASHAIYKMLVDKIGLERLQALDHAYVAGPKQ